MPDFSGLRTKPVDRPPLESLHGAVKQWLGQHEGNLDEKHLAPFRKGLEAIAADIPKRESTKDAKAKPDSKPDFSDLRAIKIETDAAKKKLLNEATKRAARGLGRKK